MTCVASSEWPPRSKKLSWTPTRSSPSTSAQMLASVSSIGPRGGDERGVSSRDRSRSGAGRASRSTLPFGVSGSASSATNAEGTMYSGSDALEELAQLAAAGAGGPAPSVT